MIGPYQIDSIITGDAIECLAAVPQRSLDAIITDPPYFLPAQHYQTRTVWPRSLSDLSILEHFYASFFDIGSQKLKHTGVFYVFCDGQSYPVFFATAYRHVRRVLPLIWDKVTSINGYSWRHQHELILFAEMDEAEAVKTGDGDILTCRAVPVDQREHPAEKPIPLLERLIRKNVKPGGLICDPFVGSGATAIAARQANVHYIGFERDAGYAEIARHRVETAPGTLELEEPEQLVLTALD
jgi:site-specific DNA-methyltransferase (adenine-specific)